MKSIRDLDPATYQPHAIHQPGRIWAETNCYTDVLIELLHGMGHEPSAGLAFTLGIDFEHDQWTFFKFPIVDLHRLYGLDIQELNPWRDLALHVQEQVEHGRPVLVELDSYFLPDTHGTAYQLAHVKSTVAVNEIDVEARHMGYFHGQGYYHVDGQDFSDLFQLDGLVHERMLPPYIEYARIRTADQPRSRADLVERSLTSLGEQVRFLPAANPFHAFRVRLAEELPWLMSESIETFHAYSFATLRQYGACYELAETYLRWLSGEGVSGLDPSADAFREISQNAKTFQFQLARAVARGRELALDPLDGMADAWDRAVDPLRAAHG